MLCRALIADRVSHGRHDHGGGRGCAAGSRIDHRAVGVFVSSLYPEEKGGDAVGLLHVLISGSLGGKGRGAG